MKKIKYHNWNVESCNVKEAEIKCCEEPITGSGITFYCIREEGHKGWHHAHGDCCYSVWKEEVRK